MGGRRLTGGRPALGAPGAHPALDRLLEAVSPRSGAFVMGTGIVSVALSLDGRETLSRLLLAIGCVVWLVLAVLLPVHALQDPARFRGELGTPAALTAVAGTAVLGTRLTLLGWHLAGEAALAIALVLWLSLDWPVLRRWRTPTVGASFMLTVATESLALLAAALAFAERAEWLLVASFVPFALGLVFYAFVLGGFDFHQLATGLGDHWVTGGALAICTVAAGRIALACEHLNVLEGAHSALEGISLALWGAALVWLPALVVCELRWPRLRYGVRRWSTVFPVGMYAACSFVVGEVASAPAITSFARVWVWVALAVWLLVAGGLVRSASLRR